jgi:hypothetical protein
MSSVETNKETSPMTTIAQANLESLRTQVIAKPFRVWTVGSNEMPIDFVTREGAERFVTEFSKFGKSYEIQDMEADRLAAIRELESEVAITRNAMTTNQETSLALHPFQREGNEVVTRGGVTVLLSATPHWSAYHKAWYVKGFKVTKAGRVSKTEREWGQL